MRIAVLSNINIDPLKGFLSKFGFEDQYYAGYNQFMIELINPNSHINQNTPNVLFIHLDGESLFKIILSNGRVKYDQAALNDFIISISDFAVANPNTNIIISNIVLPAFSTSTYLNNQNSPIIFEQLINRKILKLSEKNKNIYCYRFDSIVRAFGEKLLYDEKFWYLGRIKYTNTAFFEIAKHIQNTINAIQGKTKKVLVLDLDNTLWGGVVGEDGFSGILLSEDGVGKIFRDFQSNIKLLSTYGIILTVCSKNNENDALEILNNHKMMILKSKDFIIKKINWNNKVDNIKQIAKELDLGLDSFVFIDDNPVERELVKQQLPEVSVPDFPKHIDQLNTWFINEVVYPLFPKIVLTDEDKKKGRQYERNILRKSLESTLDIKKYINTLQIRLNCFVNEKKHIERIAQLTQKTNQFNLSTKRYSESQIENFMNSDSVKVFSLEYSDKYGNEGIIGASIVIYKDSYAEIDTFLMSCRVIGRNVEFSFFNEILKHIPYNFIKAEYLPTSRNNIFLDFYLSCGFIPSKNILLSKEQLLTNITSND